MCLFIPFPQTVLKFQFQFQVYFLYILNFNRSFKFHFETCSIFALQDKAVQNPPSCFAILSFILCSIFFLDPVLACFISLLGTIFTSFSLGLCFLKHRQEYLTFPPHPILPCAQHLTSFNPYQIAGPEAEAEFIRAEIV